MVVQNQRNSVAIKLLYIFFLLPFIINYIIGDKSSSHIISGAFSVRNYSEILFMILNENDKVWIHTNVTRIWHTACMLRTRHSQP